MPLVRESEGKYGIRSAAYVRPGGSFNGAREIRRFAREIGGNEIALHGEFPRPAGRFGDEFKTAAGGVFVPVLHPLYFDLVHCLCRVENIYRLGASRNSAEARNRARNLDL